ncbi:ABC transporter ATP-binding protein [Candidatus Enterococcus willemsii]|uniref:ABC transporter ATP-binding protein n=1 Tax=Candidatus Enterococcus willemsii TaxID=1857215 RepID=A0ABQ6YYN0_9ENTE|nr:ABC transporter ATP-binding protein [Enterococcus sp. CU12B]KAF1302750.1 ABC transporter ATP-binding protein [Enterococcus sp. CU12B]
MTIELRGINKKYENKVVLDNITLTLREKFSTILGESGCGKTTLLKILAGLVTPDNGEIMLNKNKLFSKSEKVNLRPNQRNLAMVFQDFALWPHMTVFDNVAYSLKGNKEEKAAKVMDALRMVQLEEFAQRRPSELSGGQQQRVSLARALAPRPKVILFDEALSALDAVLREKMQTDIVQLISQTDSQAVFVTHDQHEAMSMSDQIIVMEKGRVSQIGTPKEIYEEPANHYVANFIGKINLLEKDVLIRPEFVHASKGDSKHLHRIFRVLRSQFTGNCYIIHGEVDGNPWLFYSETPFVPGEQCDVYFEEQQLIKIGGY